MTGNILIIIDLEGIIGVNDMEDTSENELLLEKEIDCILNSLKGGESVYLCYDHNDGILPNHNKYKNRVRIIQKVNNINFQIRYRGAFLIGFHDKASGNGKFAHTYRDEIEGVFINNKELGEIELIKNLLDYYNIPLLLVSAEKSVVKNLNYKCVYHEIDRHQEIEKNYTELNERIRQTCSQEGDRGVYADEKVIVVYRKHVLESCKKYNLKLRSIFKDTLDFFSYLEKLHIPLNKILTKRIESLWEDLLKNKPSDRSQINNIVIEEILSKSISDVSIKELVYLNEYFRQSQ